MNSQLIHGDCLEVMKNIAGGSIDLILCDLPYGMTECEWDSVIPMQDIWSAYKRIIKPAGVVVLTAAQPFTSALVMSNLPWYRSEWIWEKGNATGFLNAKKQQLRAHESVLVFYQQQPTFNPQMTHGHEGRTTSRKTVNSECYGKSINLTEYDSTSRYPRSVQFFSSDKQKGSFHPTQKPVALMEYLISTYSNVGDTVLDNCMGSGTTGVAACRTGRNFIGIELDLGYFETAHRRIYSESPLFSDIEVVA